MTRSDRNRPVRRRGRAPSMERGPRIDIPTDEADVAALRRARRASVMSLAEVIDAARRYGASLDQLARRRGPRGEPFTLGPAAAAADEE